MPQWVSLTNTLDDAIKQRTHNKLTHEDAPRVKEVLDAMLATASPEDTSRMWNKSFSGVHDAAINCNLVAHFFVARLYDGEALQIRAHLINSESEDTAHSHGSSFFSYCLSGGYTHEIWHKLPRSRNEGRDELCYFETVRTTSSLQGSTFSESVRRDGSFELAKDLTHEHERDDLYFFEAAHVFHKVCVRERHLKPDSDPIITLVVRGKEKTFADSHFVTVRKPLSEEVRTRSVRVCDDRSDEKLLLETIRSKMAETKAPVSVGHFRVFA